MFKNFQIWTGKLWAKTVRIFEILFGMQTLRAKKSIDKILIINSCDGTIQWIIRMNVIFLHWKWANNNVLKWKYNFRFRLLVSVVFHYIAFWPISVVPTLCTLNRKDMKYACMNEPNEFRNTHYSSNNISINPLSYRMGGDSSKRCGIFLIIII